MRNLPHLHSIPLIATCILSLYRISALQTPFQTLLNSGLSSSTKIQRLKQLDFPSACGTVKGVCSEVSYRQNDLIMDIPMTSAIAATENDKSIQQLAIQLIEEFHLEDKSKFSAYIALLPAPGTIQTPFHWSEDELECLAYPSLTKSVQNQRKKWRKLYDALPKDKYSRPIDFSRFVWGMENVASRAFTGVLGMDAVNLKAFSVGSIASILVGIASFQLTNNEAFPIALGILAICLSLAPLISSSNKSSTVLLPIIDSCNHQGSSPMASLALEPSSGRFIVRADRDISSGSQITISYGKRSNDDLLQYFGFVEEDNVHDRFVITTPLARLVNILQTNSSSSQPLLTDISEKLHALNFKDLPVIITRGALNTWSLGSLEFLNGRMMQDSTVGDPRLIYALQILLENEISSFRKQVELNGIDPTRRRVIETFRKEKLRILQSAVKVL